MHMIDDLRSPLWLKRHASTLIQVHRELQTPLQDLLKLEYLLFAVHTYSVGSVNCNPITTAFCYCDV